MTMVRSPGQRLRQALELAADQQQILPFVGIYNLFSASLAADRFEALFLSGFGLAASAFGLPDIGFIGWGDLTTTTSRLRALLPNHHLVVDIDDGFGDVTVASQGAIEQALDDLSGALAMTRQLSHCTRCCKLISSG